ncbi:sulfur carrier protein [Pullulanibacillus pueri]|uniref:Sulfur carrier protein ThiS n=1 Tax=Pullulanibacillus pueri TaxID=1437324 RepID=A0A8J2ZU76_9BACL|nr:sulfur carrier protein ThiS [Pullulanibacillus pueri]MBM7681282.1 sulfur carrier protein [Pullulanibacillus pueri]GGH77755.1 sulfur carrier protein ThiS [Pullulanibacillus pueri]
MTLMINGKTIDVPNSVQTVAQLLAHLKLEKKITVVELNQTIIDKSSQAETALTHGDRVEIVHFIGGG